MSAEAVPELLMNPDSERTFSVYIDLDGHEVRFASALPESEARAIAEELEKTATGEIRVARETSPDDRPKK